MRNIFKLCSAFFLLFTASSVNAQWIQTNGPFGCSVNCMLQHDSVILCGTLQGLYYSSDDGITWQDYPLFQNKDVQSIYEKGDTLILLYSSGFVEQYYYDSVFSITSFNGGITWSPPVFFSQFGAVATSLHDANGKVIALDKFTGPYVSNDYGLTWTQIHIPFGFFVDLIYSGNYMMLITINGAGTLNYFFMSKIDSIAFTQIDSRNYAGFRKSIVDSVLFGNHADTSGNINIVKSVDFGITWSTIATTESFQTFYTDSYDSIFWYYTYQGFVIYSSDYGTSWDSAFVNSDSLPLNFYYSDAVDLGNNNLLLTNGADFVKYNSVLDSITLLNNNIKGESIYYINSNDSVIYCTGSKFYRSSDDGSIWNSMNRTYGNGPQLIMGDTLFYANFDVYRSYDGGITWTTQTMPTMVFNMAKKGGRIYASEGHTYYSDDLGNHWNQLNATPSQTVCGFSDDGGSICVYANHLFMTGFEGSVFRLNENDLYWTNCFCIPFQQFQSYNEPVLYTLSNSVVIWSDVGMYYSNDTGATWNTCMRQDLPRDVTGSFVAPYSLVAKGSEWIGAFGKMGVLVSSDNGNHWQPLVNSPSPFIATGLTISHDQLFVATDGRGVWTTMLPLTVNKLIEKNNQLEIYPNPTCDVIRLKGLKEGSHPLAVFIYDSSGRLTLMTKVNSDQSINVGSLMPGYYLARIFFAENDSYTFRFVKEGK